MKGFVEPVLFCSVVCLALITSEAQLIVTPSTLGQSKACANHYCQNGGLCVPFIFDLYTCTCQPGFTGEFCERSSTSDMYAQSGLVTELMDKAPPKVLKITYAGNNILDQNTGKENTPTQVRYQPLSIVWPDMESDHYYTIIMIDPDMPSRSTPIEQKTQVLHWLMVNIPGAGVGGRQLAPYIGSGPPPGTGIHRYTFLVFDEGKSPKDYTSVEPVDLVQIGKRVNWSFVQPGKPWTLREFITWAKMGLPIAGNFYQAQWDTWVDQLWKTFDQYYE